MHSFYPPSRDEIDNLINVKLVSEAFGCAIVDTNSSKFVCSQTWLDEYIETWINKVNKLILVNVSKGT